VYVCGCVTAPSLILGDLVDGGGCGFLLNPECLLIGSNNLRVAGSHSVAVGYLLAGVDINHLIVNGYLILLEVRNSSLV